MFILSISDIIVLGILLLIYLLLHKRIKRFLNIKRLENQIEVMIFLNRYGTNIDTDVVNEYEEIIEKAGLYYLYDKYPDFFTKD